MVIEPKIGHIHIGGCVIDNITATIIRAVKQ
jgi:hypothetical protein